MPVSQQEGLSGLAGCRCWVVGCGFLGSCMVGLCRAAGMQVLAIDRAGSADVQGDAGDAAVLASARALLEPQYIFCTVATHGGDESAYRAAYLHVPRALHEACPSARVVFCSSSSVYGEQSGAVVHEGSACTNPSSRAQLLLQAEEQVRAWGGCVARMVPMYGAGRCELLRRFVQREPELPGAESRILNYVHRKDAARALLFLAAFREPLRVNVCADSFSKGEVYGALARLTGLPRVGEETAGGRRGLSHQRVSAQLLRSLGWCPQQSFLPWAERQWRAEG